MNYSFLEAAKDEFEEAVSYYEEQKDGLEPISLKR
jgi:hypothetical protein